MTTYQPVDCDLHDFLEIACLKGYQLNIVLVDGTAIVAKAVNTKATNGEEFLIVESGSEPELSERSEIRLDRIRRISPVDSGAEFGVVDFIAGSQHTP